MKDSYGNDLTLKIYTITLFVPTSLFFSYTPSTIEGPVVSSSPCPLLFHF